VRGSTAFRPILAAGTALAAVALALGCGEAKRDAREPKRDFTVEVVKASFPARQAIAHDARLELAVRNAGGRTIPDVAVTLDSLSYQSAYPNLAARERPTWIVNQGPGPIANPPVETEEVNPPGGGLTAFVHTWALGALAPGATRTFVWHVTPVKAGSQSVRYQVAAGLDGKARARLANGLPAAGRLAATVAPRPPATHVNGQTGTIAPGSAPISPGPAPAAP
jgi:hypothetical protein